VPESQGKLREKGKLTLLPGGPGRMDAVKGGDKRLMVCEQSEGPSFEQKTEMTDSQKNGQKLPIKGGIIPLGRGKLLGKES
jgi:hypothetical protein